VSLPGNTEVHNGDFLKTVSLASFAAIRAFALKEILSTNVLKTGSCVLKYSETSFQTNSSTSLLT
jgi:hypothetical protein